jgi:hypothetical protein
MKYAAGVLVFLMGVRGSPPTAAPSPLPAPPAPSPQEWLADPVLPELFRGVAAEWPEDALSFEIPPLRGFPAPGLQEPADPESAFPRGITGLDIQRWQEEDERHRIREWLSEGTLGLPMLLPQIVLESFLPRGIAIGPSSFLYRTSPGSTSLALIVFDQILFHEAEFVAALSARSEDAVGTPVADLSHSQKRVFRKAFMGGFRASYAMPKLTMDLVFQTAAEHGVLGYLLAPPVGGALLYMKGIDQKVELHEDLKLRFQVARVRDWMHAARSGDRDPVLCVELRFRDLPLGLIASFDLSERGLAAEFVGVGTSLEALEDLLGREEYNRRSR